MIRVFLVDDHELVRTGVRMLIGKEVDMEIVGEAGGGEEGRAGGSGLGIRQAVHGFHGKTQLWMLGGVW